MNICVFFLFRSDKNSGCYGILKFPLTCMEESGNWHFPLSGWEYLNFVFTYMFIECSFTFKATFVKITLFVWFL